MHLCGNNKSYLEQVATYDFFFFLSCFSSFVMFAFQIANVPVLQN